MYETSIFSRAIDTEFFNPYNIVNQTMHRTFPEIGLSSSLPFVFLSIFAFGYRKGWDIFLMPILQSSIKLMMFINTTSLQTWWCESYAQKRRCWNYYLNRKENADIATMDGNITKFIASYAFKTTGKCMDQLPQCLYFFDIIEAAASRPISRRTSSCYQHEEKAACCCWGDGNGNSYRNELVWSDSVSYWCKQLSD